MKSPNTNTESSQAPSKAPRLGILKEFIKRNGLLNSDIAAALGKTQQALFRNYRIDDMYIAELDSIATAFGYVLDVDIRRYAGETRQKDNIVTMETHIKRYYDEGRLPYLCMAMARYNITILQLAKDLGMSDTAMRHMFNVNNISLSRLMEICNIYGLSLYLDIRPAGQDEIYKTDGRGPRLVTTLTSKRVTIDIPFADLGTEEK